MNDLLLNVNSNTVNITISDIFLHLALSLLMGIGIFFTYKKTFQGVLYQKSFNVSLVAITMILTFLIMIIKGNLVLSLGLLGALSIVRFRTPLKDPLDLVFVFWAIAIGIANGIGFFHVSIITSIFVAGTLFVMLRLKEADQNYLLILHLTARDFEQKIIEIVGNAVEHYQLKSKTINAGGVEIILEVKLKNHDSGFINQISNESSVSKATLIAAGDNSAL